MTAVTFLGISGSGDSEIVAADGKIYPATAAAPSLSSTAALITGMASSLFRI